MCDRTAFSYACHMCVFTTTELKKWDGMDIVRKGTGRKTRYLFVLPAILNATQGGGKLGEITKMDTENPVLYFDFPQVCTGVCHEVKPGGRVNFHHVFPDAPCRLKQRMKSILTEAKLFLPPSHFCRVD